MKILINRAAFEPPKNRIAVVGGTVIAPVTALDVMLQRVANSTRLTLAEKRNFAEALTAAYKTKDSKQIMKIMMAIAELEATRKQGSFSRNTLAEIKPPVSGEAAAAKPQSPAVLAGSDLIQQLLNG